MTTCDQEPIHIINHIQNHGYLLGVRRQDYSIRHASANTPALFGEEVLGWDLWQLEAHIAKEKHGKVLTDFLDASIRSDSLNEYNPYKVSIFDEAFNMICSTYEELIILEFEPSLSDEMSLKNQTIFGQIMLKLNVSNDSLQETLQTVAHQLRELLGYDRVMVYKFWEDWHGEVVAESKIEALEPFLGLHYPATDIPKQARLLYTKNLTRIIADTGAPQVPLVSLENRPLDLSHSQLRAVSLLHIEYLHNMGVGASYSISLLKNGKLWGLIACHHRSARFIDYEKRKISEIISSYLSNVLDIMDAKVSEEAKDRYRHAIETLEAQMREDWNITKGLSEHPTTLMDINRSTGAAIFMGGELSVIGKTPTTEEIMSIVEWVRDSQKREPLFHTSNLSRFIPRADACTDTASGLLVATLSEELQEYLLWFKPEKLQSISWAGKPNKESITEESGKIRLSPRKSFEKWTHEVRNTSEEWDAMELKTADLLIEKVRSIQHQKANEIRRLNEELKRAYEELDSFSYTLSHDLKTPLNTISGYLDLFVEDNEDLIKNDPIFAKITKNTDLMRKMIGSILAYSKMSREELVLQDVKLGHLFDEIIAQRDFDKNKVSIQIDLPKGCSVMGNKIMLYQVFSNLIDNAIKYADPSRSAVIIIDGTTDGNMTTLRVKDNGIGFADKYSSKVFQLFQRIPNERGIEGTGIGLTIVKRIVEKHRGIIRVESREGEGSTFYVSLFNQFLK